MAVYRWEVPFLEFPGVAQLLVDAATAERRGDRQGLAELVDRIRGLPGYPRGADPAHDTIVLLPKNARIFSDWGKWRGVKPKPDTLTFHNLSLLSHLTDN